MNFKKLITFCAIAIAIFGVIFVGCKKNTNTNATTTLTSDDNGGYASDAAKLESTGNSIMTIADNAVIASGAGLRTTGCATITKDSSTASGVTTHTITIDFGSGCTGFDGKSRSGKILIYYSGKYKDSGSVHSILSDNFYINGNKVVIHKIVTNKGTNTSGQEYYSIQVADSIFLTSDSVISWAGNRTRTWNTGYNTATILDDSYLITGSTTVTRANGHMFTFTIESGAPLYVAVDCPWVEAGKVDITSLSFVGTRILNYGDTPNCDALATLTVNSVVHNITLR